MKVIIDLIEDIRTSINNDSSFSLKAMGLYENESGDFLPVWESGIVGMRIDDEQSRLFLFLGKEEGLMIESFLETLNALPNQKMMYEVCISYAQSTKRIDASLLGFGESLSDKTYLFFVPGMLE